MLKLRLSQSHPPCYVYIDPAEVKTISYNSFTLGYTGHPDAGKKIDQAVIDMGSDRPYKVKVMTDFEYQDQPISENPGVSFASLLKTIRSAKQNR
jgi:hypothetical protein